MPWRRATKAAALSALWPGLGQLWLGQRARGGAMMLLSAFLLAMMVLTFSLPFLIAAWAWSVADAHALALRLEARAHPPKEGPFQTCPGCGAPVRADFRRCPECGQRLPELWAPGAGPGPGPGPGQGPG